MVSVSIFEVLNITRYQKFHMWYQRTKYFGIESPTIIIQTVQTIGPFLSPTTCYIKYALECTGISYYIANSTSYVPMFESCHIHIQCIFYEIAWCLYVKVFGEWGFPCGNYNHVLPFLKLLLQLIYNTYIVICNPNINPSHTYFPELCY